MSGLSWALLIKPLALVVLAVAYYWLVIVPLRKLQKRLPDNALVRFLFRERGRQDANASVDLDKGRLNRPPVIGRE